MKELEPTKPKGNFLKRNLIYTSIITTVAMIVTLVTFENHRLILLMANPTAILVDPDISEDIVKTIPGVFIYYAIIIATLQTSIRGIRRSKGALKKIAFSLLSPLIIFIHLAVVYNILVLASWD